MLHLRGLRIHAEPGSLAKCHQPVRGLRGGTRQRPNADFLNARSHADESQVIGKSLTGITNEVRKVAVQPNKILSAGDSTRIRVQL